MQPHIVMIGGTLQKDWSLSVYLISGDFCTQSGFRAMQSPRCAPLWPAVSRSPAGKCRGAVGAFAFFAARCCRCSTAQEPCKSPPCAAPSQDCTAAQCPARPLPCAPHRQLPPLLHLFLWIKGANHQVYHHSHSSISP